MADKHERLHAIVSGMVQGVNFRYYTRERAQRLRLTGWVRNLWDGTVEVLAEGPRPALEKLLEFLHHGPSAASVTGVQAEWLPAADEFTSFETRW